MAKRLLACLLAVCIFVGFAPTEALAAPGQISVVTLDSGNGSPPITKILIEGGPYGKLPAPAQMPGYVFDGWYTRAQGGEKVTEDTRVKLPGNHTLYAHWSRRSVTHRVTLDAGYLAPPVSFQVTEGGYYNSLIIQPSHGQGYTFAGWYTEIIGGTRITSRTPVTITSDQTLYAHWSSTSLDLVTLTFDGCGGIVGESFETTHYGGTYPSFPIPWREGRTFEGWYTAPAGGEKIVENGVVNARGHQILYAHWNDPAPPPVSPGPTLQELTYSFDNSRKAFGYDKGYKIPLERYQFIFGDTALAQALYRQTGAWGGSCYGMSSTSSLFFRKDNGIFPDSFRGGAAVPSALAARDYNSAWGLSLTEFIEAMQVSQNGSTIQKDYNANRNRLDALCREVERVQSGSSGPVVIAVFGMEGGHALVGYELVEISGSESRLMVYDCNYPDQERYITLTKNASGQYTGWYYYLNNRYHWGTGYPGSWISYVPYTHFQESWENRKGMNNVNLLTVNSGNATVEDMDGRTVAVIQDGEVVPGREDVFPVVSVGLTMDANSGESDTTSLWLPSDSLYRVTNKDRSVKTFEASMAHVEQSATVATTGSHVVLGVNDDQELNYVELDKASQDSYTIDLYSSLESGHRDVRLSGTSQTGAAPILTQIAGRLYANGLDGAALKVDGKDADSEKIASQIPQLPFPNDGKPAITFTDVKAGSWYADAVSWAAGNGITSGVANGKFEPGGICTRGQMVTFLWRASGSPEPKSSGHLFKDVRSGDYYDKAVRWAVENEITAGTSPDTFSPNAPCTRAQTVTFLWRAQGSPKSKSAGNPFGDVRKSDFFCKAVQWAVEEKVTSGTSATAFSPSALCTRAQAVTFLYRVYGKK